MRQNGEMTDEKRLALLDEFLYSGKSKKRFEKEKVKKRRVKCLLIDNIKLNVIK